MKAPENKAEAIELIVSRLPLLQSIPQAEIPTEAEARAWLAPCFVDKGKPYFRKTIPADAPTESRLLWRLIRWQFGNGNLYGLFAAQHMAAPEVVKKAETLATVCAILSGRRTAGGRPCMASKAIPRCVPWRVRFLRNGKTEAEIQVVTVSRLFARWLALEQFPQGYSIGMRLVVSRMK